MARGALSGFGKSLQTLQVYCLKTWGSESPSPADFASYLTRWITAITCHF